MKKLIFTMAFFVAVMVCFSQTLERQVISSAGSFSTAGGISLSATVGEVAVTTLISGSVVLTQGFQQPNPEDLTAVPEEQKINLTYKIYPNPTSDKLVVELTVDKPAELIIQVYDMSGKDVILITKTIKVTGSVNELVDMSTLATGNYLVKLVYGKDAVKTFQVMKN